MSTIINENIVIKENNTTLCDLTVNGSITVEADNVSIVNCTVNSNGDAITSSGRYLIVKNRILQLLGERNMSIHKLAMESAIAPSSIKNILYGKSQNPGIVTIKMLCDGFGITLIEFFDTSEFANLEQEIK